MAGGFWTSLVDRVVAQQAALAPRAAATRSSAPSRPDDQDHEPPPGTRLAGPLRLLDRLVSVRGDTVAVTITEQGRPELHLPGEILRPRLRPTRDRVWVLVISTAPTALDLPVDDLVAVDGSDLGPTVVRLTVQLAPDGHRRVLELAAEHHDDLEDQLLRLVDQELTDRVRAAVRTTPLGEDPYAGLARLLAEQWLPRTFVGGALVWHDVVVMGPQPDVGPDPGSEAEGAFTLTLDDDLAGVWRSSVPLDLYGIAGAQVLDHSTVVAVTPGLAAYESSRLQEAFGRHFADPSVRLIAGPADSYAELVETWFTQVDSGSGRLVTVESIDEAVLRVVVAGSGATSSRARQAGVGTPADRKALRRLIPHQHLDFVAGERDAER